MLELFTTEVKMKKIFSAICLVAFLASGIFTFAACVPSTSQIDEFGNKLDKADSYEMDVTMSVSMIGPVNYILKVDGNKAYTSAFLDEPEQYLVYYSDSLLTYTKYNDSWYTDISHLYNQEDLSLFSDEKFKTMFDGNNYEYSKDEKAFVKKDEILLNFDDLIFTSMKLKLENNKCIITGNAAYSGIVTYVVIEFKNLGKTTVVLPV